MQFDKDNQGAAIATGSEEEALLTGFLQSDIQEDKVVAGEILGIVAGVIGGRMHRYEFRGNAHEVTIDRDEVHIALAKDESVCSDYPLQTFRHALQEWQRFIDEPAAIN